MSNVIDFPAKEEEDQEMEWFFTVEVYKKPSGKYEYQLQIDEDMDNDLDVADALARMAFQVAPDDWSQRVDCDELIIEPIDESETDEI